MNTLQKVYATWVQISCIFSCNTFVTQHDLVCHCNYIADAHYTATMQKTSVPLQLHCRHTLEFTDKNRVHYHAPHFKKQLL